MEELRSNCKESRYPDAVIDIAIDVERSELYCSPCIDQVYDPEIDEAEIGFAIDSQLIIGLGGKSGVDVVAVRSNKKRRLDSQLIIGSQFLVAPRDRRGLNNLGSTCFMNAVLRFGETNEPAIYRIKDDLEFSVEILEWSGKSWEPYVADDVQVQFFMMSPYVLKTLSTDKKGLFHTTFKVPDVYGVFQFKVEYEKLGYTTLSLSKQSLEDAKHYFLVSIVSCYSLFPLLHEPQEYLIKVLLLLLHSMVMWLGFAAQCTDEKALKKEAGELKSKFELGCIEKTYLVGLVLVEIVSQFLHPYFLGD